MMSLLNKYLRIILCILTIALCLAGCAMDQEPEPTVPQWGWLREKSEYLTVLAEPEDFLLLEECINLKALDLTGSTCYDEILDYVNRHPQVEVFYSAPLGELILSNTETGAALEPGTYDAAGLLRQLKYLPGLTVLELPATTLGAEDIAAIEDTYPDLQLRYSVSLLGREYLPEDTLLDLTEASPEDLDSVLDALPLLPDLTEVQLMDARGESALSPVDVKQLMQALPDAAIRYSFELFGQTLSTDMERVEYKNTPIGDSGEAQIRAALDILPRCTYFKLEDCGLSNETMASIRDDYPAVKIVWRVYLGQYSLCTDADTLRSVYGVYNEYADTLKYCTDLKYIDMGHNVTLSDINFIEYMPDLEIVILSGSAIRDVQPFRNCKKLEWLELAYCTPLENIQGLEECENLRFLNLSFTQVSDLTPIEKLPLERFVCLDPEVRYDERTAFQESHPDCWIRFTGSDPYSLGWRYNDIGITRFEYYQKIRDIFHYDEVDRRLAQEEANRKEQEEATDPPVSEETTPPATESSTPVPDTPVPDPGPETEG